MNKSMQVNFKILELLNWLDMPHDVDITTCSRAEYWARQFKVACNKAKEIINDAKEV